MKQPDPNRQLQLYNIAIYESGTLMTDLTGDTPRHFMVDEAELIKLLRIEQTITFRPEPGLLKTEVAPTSETRTYHVAPRKEAWDIILRDKENQNQVVKVHLPGFVVSVKIDTSSRKVTGIAALCYAGKEPKVGGAWYEMPLPNFHRDGNMCLGGVSRKVGPRESLLDAALSVIFDSVFNTHANLVGKDDLPFPKFIEKHGGKVSTKLLRQAGKIKPDFF